MGLPLILSNSRQSAGLLAGLAAGALWGLVFVAPLMAPGLSAVDLAAGRFAVFGLLAGALCAWGLWRGGVWPTLDQALAAAGLSVLGFTGYYSLLVLAIDLTGAEVPALIIGTIPLWVMWLGKPEGLAWRRLWPGWLCTAIGLGLMVWAGGHDPATTHAAAAVAPLGQQMDPRWWGVGLALLSMASWTAFALLNARWLSRHPEVNSALWTNWLGVATGLGALMLWAALGTPWAALRASPDFVSALLVCLLTGLGSAWLASWLWTVASKRLSASLCGQLIVSETLFALVYAFAWNGRAPTAWQWAAVALFVVGIVSSVRAHR